MHLFSLIILYIVYNNTYTSVYMVPAVFTHDYRLVLFFFCNLSYRREAFSKILTIARHARKDITGRASTPPNICKHVQ